MAVGKCGMDTSYLRVHAKADNDSIGYFAGFLASGLGSLVIAGIVWGTQKHPCGIDEGIQGQMCTGATPDFWSYFAVAAPVCAVIGFVGGFIIQAVSAWWSESSA
jgi:hypothetical protein